MIKDNDAPVISLEEKERCFRLASESSRHRYPLILHETGAEMNRVFNFMLDESYMQPHHHPSDEMSESIHLVEGGVTVIFFDSKGRITESIDLQKATGKLVVVPPCTWHTYIVHTSRALTYETMKGKYNPLTWKKVADWAPNEKELSSRSYLLNLKSTCRINHSEHSDEVTKLTLSC